MGLLGPADRQVPREQVLAQATMDQRPSLYHAGCPESVWWTHAGSHGKTPPEEAVRAPSLPPLQSCQGRDKGGRQFPLPRRLL